MPFRWRPDGDYVKDAPVVRRILPYIMRTRTESVTFFEQKIDTRKTTAFLRDFRERTGVRATVLHLAIWAAAQALHARPRMNRFTAGGRLYQRRGIWVSFSGKKAKSDDHPIVTIKKRIDPTWTFEELIRHIDGGIDDGRSDRKSSTDKELELAFKLPAFLVDLIVRLLMKLDYFGLLPKAMIDSDPLFTSLFIAPLGSIGMDPCYHHLFEYGTCPIFMVLGRNKDEVVPGSDGRLEVRPLITIQYTFDERVEDGLYAMQSLELFKQWMENPAEAMVRPGEPLKLAAG